MQSLSPRLWLMLWSLHQALTGECGKRLDTPVREVAATTNSALLPSVSMHSRTRHPFGGDSEGDGCDGWLGWLCFIVAAPGAPRAAAAPVVLTRPSERSCRHIVLKLLL